MVLDYRPPKALSKDTSTLLIHELQELFEHMNSQNVSLQMKENSSGSKKAGSVSKVDTKKLMKKIKSLNQLFDNDDHHDSHEFLIWLLNHIHEEIITPPQGYQKPNGEVKSTIVSENFEGKLVSVTRCLECENGNERDEAFMALSVDIERGFSLN